MEIQKYLRINGVEKLKKEYDIKVKEYENEIVLNYNIFSPKLNTISDVCRGLILDKNNFEIISRSYDRFYNLNEVNTKINNFKNYSILEKLDGSLINLYFNKYKNEFCFSSRGTAYAECENINNVPFISIINDILKENKEFLIKNLNKDFTYIFELIGPDNIVIKKYKQNKLILHGIRNKKTGKYKNYDQMNEFIHKLSIKNIEIVKLYNFQNFDDLQKNIDKLPDCDEGYVLWDQISNHRIKIKNPSYVYIHYLRNNGVLSEKRIMLLIHNNDYSEYLSYFPEDEPVFNKFKKAYDKMIFEIEKKYESVCEIENQKEFALQIKKEKCKYILFGIKKGKSLIECLNTISDDKLFDLIKYYGGVI